MYALKWWKSSTRMHFEGEAAGSGSGGGDGSGSASSGSSAPPPSGGDAGGGSTPAAPDGGGAASPEPSPSPDDGAGAPDEMDWSALGSTDDLDQIEVPAAPPAAAAAKPKKYGAAAQVPDPAAPPAPVAPKPAAPAAAAPAAPAAPAPAQPAPAGEAPPVQLSPSDPLGIATALEANRDASLAHLAQTRFALSQEDIAELEDNAAAFVPKMMARVLHESQVSMMKFLAQSVPGMMKQFSTVQTANNQAEDQFFAAHQALGLDKANAEHRKTAFRIASIYRKSNPDMPMEQLIADVGPMVAMSLKMPLVPGAAPVPGSPTRTPQPAPAAKPTGFRPAVNGGGGASPATEAANEWAGMGEEYD